MKLEILRNSQNKVCNLMECRLHCTFLHSKTPCSHLQTAESRSAVQYRRGQAQARGTYNFISQLEDHENEDLRPPYENEDSLRKRRPPVRKRRPPMKTKSHHENEDTLLKQVQKRLVLLLWTKIMFMRHTTKTKILTEILNSEFGTFVVYYGIYQKKSPMEPSMELL